MNGYHKIKKFVFLFNDRNCEEEEFDLPEGWKPFAAVPFYGGITIIARKWMRTEKVF